MDEQEREARTDALKIIGLLMEHIKDGEEEAAYEKLARAFRSGGAVISLGLRPYKASGSLGELVLSDPLRK